jgi:ribosomal protein S4
MPRRSPVEKRSRRAGVELGLKGARQVAGKSGHTRRPYPPGQQGRPGQGRRRKRDSDYLLQLREKQKLQWFYGVPAGHLSRYVDASRRRPEATGEELLANSSGASTTSFTAWGSPALERKLDSSSLMGTSGSTESG